MRRVSLYLLLALLIHPHAFARFAETPEECEQRYGKHFQEIPGHGLVAFCRLYQKQDLKICAIFVKGPADPRVGCILYSTHSKEIYWTVRRRLTQEEQDSLLATVPGQWTLPSANPAPTLQGGGARRELSVKPNSISDSRMEKARRSVRASLEAAYEYRYTPAVTEIGRNGADKYAFTFHGGLGITHHKASDAVIEWSQTVKQRREDALKPDPKKLKGF